MTLDNLASALMARGDLEAALSIAKRSLEIGETDDAKSTLASSLGRRRSIPLDKGLQPLATRALAESWGQASDLGRVCVDLIKLDSEIARCLARAVEAWPNSLPSRDLFGTEGLAAVTANPLLSVLLDAVPICDLEMERFLTMARRALLDSVGDGNGSADRVRFYSGLARQCFLNGYVYRVTPAEKCQVDELRERLEAALAADASMPVSWLVAVAAYLPLHSLRLAGRLLERSWPEEISALLTQQILEPAEERRIIAGIPRLTDVVNDCSCLARDEFDEIPSPRWAQVPRSRRADGILAYLRRAFSLAAFDRSPPADDGSGGGMEILVAGCGTGRHSIRMAQQFPTARILAVDPNRSSLAYAARKTHELGITSIEYAQADVLRLGSFGRRLDAIDARGALHHLADPWIGWRTLLSLLRPGGFMLLGLYGNGRRRDLVEQGRIAGTIDGLPSELFTPGGCRDVLLHLREHCSTLTDIERFLGENDLTFLGFELAPDILQSYRVRFPEDRAATDLSQWQVFEDENPDTFTGMYQFWVQKR